MIFLLITVEVLNYSSKSGEGILHLQRGFLDFCFGGSFILTNEDTQIKAGLRPELGINFPRLGADAGSRLQRHRIKIVYGYTWFPTGEGLEDFGHQISLVYFREANYLR